MLAPSPESSPTGSGDLRDHARRRPRQPRLLRLPAVRLRRARAARARLAILIDPDLYRRFQKHLYLGTLILFVFVFLSGTVARGSRRWIDLAFFRFQPSEFGKLLVVLALAGFLADRYRRLDDPRYVLATIGLAVPPIVLVFIQPDIGSALVYVAALGALLFVAGIRWLAPRGSRAMTALAIVRWWLSGSGHGRAQAVPEEPSDGLPASRPGPAGLDLQRHSVDHRSRLRRRNGRGVRGRPRRASTSCPSTRPTSPSRRSRSSRGSSAPHSS